MRNFLSLRTLMMAACLPLCVFMLGQQAKAQFNANAGAETKDQSVQADGFFPNELWILAGDSITWTFTPQNEVHTVTFLAANQVRPQATTPVGPPQGAGPTALPSSCTLAGSGATVSYTGLAGDCVSSTPLAGDATFTVTFPNVGDYKLVCLVHTYMNGTVHVLTSNAANAALVQSRGFYDDQGRAEARNLLEGGPDQDLIPLPAGNQVYAGSGHIVGTGGGTQYRAVVRFLTPKIVIHEGESVTWVNLDPTEPHTVTFGAEPPAADHFTPTQQVGVTQTSGPGTANDQTLTATINCGTTATCDQDYLQETNPSATYVSTAFINSGFLQAAAADRTAPGAGVPPTGDTQVPLTPTRITITFPVAGDYYYHCALHDVDGMYGEVVVQK